MPAHLIEVQGLGAFGLTPQAKAFLTKKIRKLIKDEGYPPKQAVRVAFEMARREGYKVPRPPRG